MEGWIKIHRKILSHWIWADEKYFRWWMTILLMVNHRVSKFPVGGKLYECLPGQSFKKIESWSQLFGCSKKTVVKFFNMLENDGMIKVEIIGKGNRRKHLLTVENWTNYQQAETEHVPELKPEITPKENRTGNPNVTPNKNDKECNKNEKNFLFRQRFFSILEIFYFKNFNRPINVTNHFYRHYESIGWKNGNAIPIESIESVAGNWENKITEGVNCPATLLVKWKVVYGILKNNQDSVHKYLLAVRPALFENNTLTVRGKSKALNKLFNEPASHAVFKKAVTDVFGKIELKGESDKIEEEPTIINETA